MRAKELGRRGEEAALHFLEDEGYQLMDRNWHAQEGELDLIMRDEETIVFVEVKTRTSHAFGAPEESLTKTKQRRLQRSAWKYLEHEDLLDTAWRFDVIAIEVSEAGEIHRLDHYRNAIEADLDLR